MVATIIRRYRSKCYLLYEGDIDGSLIFPINLINIGKQVVDLGRFPVLGARTMLRMAVPALCMRRGTQMEVHPMEG